MNYNSNRREQIEAIAMAKRDKKFEKLFGKNSGASKANFSYELTEADKEAIAKLSKIADEAFKDA